MLQFVEQGWSGVKRMRLRRDGVCSCGMPVAAGTSAGWDIARRAVVCPGCLEARDQFGSSGAPQSREAVSGLESAADGRAGGSAQAEYERRKARREQRVRGARPRIGGFILAVTSEPQSTRAWASGAVGERRVAERLAVLAGDEVLLLHDRRIPGTRANIDHLAVGPAGVYVIDAKRYRDAVVEIRRTGGLLGPRTERLMVAGRDRTKLVQGLAPQVAAVRAALSGLPDQIAVSGLLCFVDALLPRFGRLELAGVPIVGPKRASKIVREPGRLTAEDRARIREHLAQHLRPAAQ